MFKTCCTNIRRLQLGFLGALDIKTPDDQFKVWGQSLKAHRERLGLTLRRSSQLSETVATDTNGIFSESYLSLLERGHPGAVSTLKLLSLAAIYGVDILDILRDAPKSLRDAALRELPSVTHILRRPSKPLPLSAYADRPGIDEKLFDSLTLKARNVSIPLNRRGQAAEMFAGAVIRGVAIAALVATEPPATATVFAERHPEYIEQVRTHPHRLCWTQLADVFCDYILYEVCEHAALIEAIAWWNIDFTTGLCTVEVANTSLQERLNAHRVPCNALRTVGNSRVQQFLHRSIRALPPPEPVSNVAARMSIFEMLGMGKTDDSNWPISDALATAKALSAIPIFRSGRRSDDAIRFVLATVKG